MSAQQRAQDSRMNSNASGEAAIALVRSFYEDEHNLFAGLAKDVIWEETEGMPYGGIYRGPQAILEGVFAHLGEDWEEFGADPEEVVAVGLDRVLSLGQYRGVSRRTGQSMSAAFAHLYTLHEGKVVRFRQFGDSHSFRTALE